MALPVASYSSAARRVLVIDDEPAVLRALGMVLQRRGFAVDTVSSARSALSQIPQQRYHAILSDIIMPEMTGVEFLRELRRHDLDVPVILMTAGPTLDSAIDAVEYGAQQYLLKPIEPDALVQAIGRAAALGELARAKREALAGGRKAVTLNERADLEAILKRAFDSIRIVFQPIVSLSRNTVFGYEALMRCDETLFGSYGALLAAAERVAWRPIMAKRIYRRIAAACTGLPEGAALFINAHTSDLHDGLLTGPDAPLEPIARNVVIEISDRTSATQAEAFAHGIPALRSTGFRIAVDNLGAGGAGMSLYSQLNPDFVKLDRSLVTGMDIYPARARMVRGMYALCRELDVPVIAEGVESAGERDALLALGADLAQGYLLGMPGASPDPSNS